MNKIILGKSAYLLRNLHFKIKNKNNRQTFVLRGLHSTIKYWNLEVLVFVEGGQLENPERNPDLKQG